MCKLRDIEGVLTQLENFGHSMNTFLVGMRAILNAIEAIKTGDPNMLDPRLLEQYAIPIKNDYPNNHFNNRFPGTGRFPSHIRSQRNIRLQGYPKRPFNDQGQQTDSSTSTFSSPVDSPVAGVRNPSPMAPDGAEAPEILDDGDSSEDGMDYLHTSSYSNSVPPPGGRLVAPP